MISGTRTKLEDDDPKTFENTSPSTTGQETYLNPVNLAMLEKVN
jgi:hypothetical protein